MSLVDELLGDVVRGLTGREAAPNLTWASAKDRVMRTAADHPVETLTAVVLLGSLAYWLAEKDTNPKVTSFAEALWCISSTLTVGSDVSRETAVGKLVGTLVMSFGSTLQGLVTAEVSSHRTEPRPAEAPHGVDREILEKLSEIANLLRAQPR